MQRISYGKFNHMDTGSTEKRHWENWVSQGFLADECDSCISYENGDSMFVGFDSNHPLHFVSTL